MSRNPETRRYRKLRTSLIKVELEESKRIVQRALRAEGYQRRVIRKAIQLRLPNNRNRVAWCRGTLHLPVIGYWDRVIFIDEFKVEVGANKRVYVWRRAGEEWDLACQNTPPRRKFEIMIWGHGGIWGRSQWGGSKAVVSPTLPFPLSLPSPYILTPLSFPVPYTFPSPLSLAKISAVPRKLVQPKRTI